MVSSPEGDPRENMPRLLMEGYIEYKKRYVKHLQFNPAIQNLSKFLFPQHFCHTFPAAMIEHAPLQSVYIYFDTATYDEIERDVKVILIAAWQTR